MDSNASPFFQAAQGVSFALFAIPARRDAARRAGRISSCRQGVSVGCFLPKPPRRFGVGAFWELTD